MRLPKSRFKRILLLLAVLFVIAQAVPYGRAHDNPAGGTEPAWDSPRTGELVRRFCYDCHSNETTWPWYSHVAPLSWLVQRDVDEGRQHLNFSELDKHHKHVDDAAEEVEDGEMPPSQYTFGRSDRQMSDAERDDLVRGLKATFGD